MDGVMEKKNNLLNFFPYFISLASVILIYLNIDYINNDGVRYLAQSELISKGKYLEAFQLHKMILYPYLIFLINYLFGLSFFISAKLLNVVAIFFISYFFIKIYQIIFPKIENSDFLILAIGFFSFVSFFDDYINFIVRDLISVSFLFGFVFFNISFLKKNNIYYLIFSLIFIIFSALLRIESAIFIIFPFLTLIKKRGLKRKHIYFIFFTILIGIFILFENSDLFKEVILKKNNISNIFISKEWFYEFDSYVVNNFEFLINNNFFNFIFKILFSLFCIFIILIKVNLINFSLFFYLRRKFAEIIKKDIVFKYLFSIFLTSIFIILLNFMLTGVFSKRYFIFAYFVIILFVVYGLKFIWKNINHRSFFYIYLFVLLVFIFFDKKKYNYEQELANFIMGNDYVYQTIFVADAKTRFYLNEFIDQDFKMNLNRNYEAIFINKGDSNNLQDLSNYNQILFNNPLDQKYIYYKAKNDH